MRNEWLRRKKLRYPELREHILLMLGAPCFPVELDDNLLDYAIEQAVILIEDIFEDELPHLDCTSFLYRLLSDGAVAYAKMMLGNIRCTWTSAGLDLVDEGRDDLLTWRDELKQLKKIFTISSMV